MIIKSKIIQILPTNTKENLFVEIRVQSLKKPVFKL